MISFPNAKINLGLNITSKREDGYHNLSSCFLPIDWKDVLEIIPNDQFQFSSSGLEIPGGDSGNLCVKAYELLKKAHGIGSVAIHLHKVIPMGAGLGGGSSDGAFTLKMLNDLFDLKLSIDELEANAKSLGADCPFFVQNKPKLVTGIGDFLEDIDIDLQGYKVAVVSPGIHVNTKTAFDGIKPKAPDYDIKEMLSQSPSTWQGVVSNDFEKTVFKAHPAIGKIKKQLLDQGAVYVSMTGTGSAVYGIFNTSSNSSILVEDYFIKECSISY